MVSCAPLCHAFAVCVTLFLFLIHCSSLPLSANCFSCCYCCVAQKFRFCGEQDAPDWILAEVSVLSKMVRRARCERQQRLH